MAIRLGAHAIAVSADLQTSDPDNGLASVEALFVAYHILGRPTTGLLDHYRWAAEFLRANGLEGNGA